MNINFSFAKSFATLVTGLLKEQNKKNPFFKKKYSFYSPSIIPKTLLPNLKYTGSTQLVLMLIIHCKFYSSSENTVLAVSLLPRSL